MPIRIMPDIPHLPTDYGVNVRREPSFTESGLYPMSGAKSGCTRSSIQRGVAPLRGRMFFERSGGKCKTVVNLLRFGVVER